jgi:hypothetical protein
MANVVAQLFQKERVRVTVLCSRLRTHFPLSGRGHQLGAGIAKRQQSAERTAMPFNSWSAMLRDA